MQENFHERRENSSSPVLCTLPAAVAGDCEARERQEMHEIRKRMRTERRERSRGKGEDEDEEREMGMHTLQWAAAESAAAATSSNSWQYFACVREENILSCQTGSQASIYHQVQEAA
jgi:hypothetical protein